MTWTTVDFDVAMEVACHEGIVRQAYKDSVGVWTWSVGMTNATGHTVERYINNPASLQHCMNVYAWALDRYAEGVRKAFAGVRLTKAQFAAALSFHWNTGAIGRASWVRHFKAGNVAKARKAFMAWNKPSEIIGRREKERDLFFDGKWANDGTMLEFTRVRPNMRPDFRSGRRINVSAELRIASAKLVAPVLDAAPQPDAIPAAPTLTTDGMVEVEVDKPVVPDAVEREVRRDEKMAWWQWLFALPASFLAVLADNPWLVAALLAIVVVAALAALIGGRRLVRRVREIAEEFRS